MSDHDSTNSEEMQESLTVLFTRYNILIPVANDLKHSIKTRITELRQNDGLSRADRQEDYTQLQEFLRELQHSEQEYVNSAMFYVESLEAGQDLDDGVEEVVSVRVRELEKLLDEIQGEVQAHILGSF
jgi:hypothetical protein